MINKKVKDLTIDDVINGTKLFRQNLASVMRQVDAARAIEKMDAMGKLPKANTVDRIIKRGIWNVDDMSAAFIKVIDKTIEGYASEERQFIRDVGKAAFELTMFKLIQDEKERNNSNGED